MPVTTLNTEFGGRTLTIETGKLANLAGGAVTVRYGDSLVLGTANRGAFLENFCGTDRRGD